MLRVEEYVCNVNSYYIRTPWGATERPLIFLHTLSQLFNKTAKQRDADHLLA